MLFYVSQFFKKFITRNNGVPTRQVKIFNHTVDEIEISIIDQNNQIQPIPSGQYYITGSYTKKGSTSVFLSTDYTVDGSVLKFSYSTYTYEFLANIKGENVPIALEIGYKDEAGEHVILQDTAFASQRYYVDGMPDPARVSQYYTKPQTDAVIDSKIETAMSGVASMDYVDDVAETKQDKITEEAKIDFGLISGAPAVPTKVSDLENDLEYQTATDLEAAVSGKANVSDLEDYQKKITAEEKLDYALLSGTPTIPTKTSDLNNDSGFQTASDVQTAISGKADASELADYQKKITNDSKLAYSLLSGTPAIPSKTSDLDNDSGFITDAALEGYATEQYVDGAVSIKQDKITADDKLDYSLLSGTPSIPTKTSDLQNDSGFITSDALSGKQDKITNDSRLDYGLISGTPSIPTKTSDLTNDSGFATSGYVQQETSGKLTTPSGGTVGQVIKKTANGAEWADDFELNPTLVQIEVKTLGQDTAYTVDFTGKQIQKYDSTSSASGSIEIQFANISNIPENTAPTVELQIPVTADVSTITMPSGTYIVEMPDTLAYTSGMIAYHDIVFRAEEDVNGEIIVYANYAYKFDEEEQA